MKCGGPIYCNIYRDKKYCRSEDKLKMNEPCHCSHNAYLCEIGHCSFLYEPVDIPIKDGKNNITSLFKKCEIAENLNLKTFKEI